MKLPKFPSIFGSTSIRTQSMLFGAIFLFLEFCFCGSLYWQTKMAEQEAKREEHYKEILKRTMDLPIATNRALKSLMSFALERKKEESAKYDRGVKEVLDSLAWLKKQLKRRKNCLRVLEQIDEPLAKGIGLMTEAKNTFDKTESIQEAVEVLKTKKELFQKDWTVMINRVQELAALEQELVEETHPEQKRLRSLIQTIIALGLGANFAAVFLYQWYFSRNIMARLGIMIDNTQKFKRSEPLNDEMKSGDEISILDKSFHDMADAVAEAQKMRQTFVAMISHDLRTPLNNVQAYLELVAEGVLGEVPPLVVTETNKTEKSVSRLIRLINDLLTLEKMEAGKMEMNCKVVYLEDIIEQSIQAIEDFARQHDVKLVSSETNVEVYADPDRLIQVLINLSSNAVKFSPKGGVVRIDTLESEGGVEVRVMDQGRGVPPEFQKIIFEKYKQVKAEDGSKKGGTGLGLPICKLIIEQLGGTIGVVSEEGKEGSTFWFKLPKSVA